MVDDRSKAEPIDEISRRIVAQLIEDGRRSYAMIGKAVGLSEAAVRQRVQRLSERGAIRVRAVLNPEPFGLTRRALLGIKVTNDAGSAAEALGGLPCVRQVDVATGSYDVVAEVLVTDDTALMELLDSVRQLASVRSVDAIPLLHRHKHASDWSLDDN